MSHYWRKHNWSSSKSLSHSECNIFDRKIFLAMWTSPGKSKCTNPFNSTFMPNLHWLCRSQLHLSRLFSTCRQPHNSLPRRELLNQAGILVYDYLRSKSTHVMHSSASTMTLLGEIIHILSTAFLRRLMLPTSVLNDRTS